MALELLLGLKAGIGRNFVEAEIAMNHAKSLKEKIEETDRPQEATTKVIHQHQEGRYAIAFKNDSDTIDDGIDFKKEEVSRTLQEEVEKAITGLNFYEQKYGKESQEYQIYSQMIESISFDPSTKALTPFGYYFKRQTEREKNLDLPEGVEHFVILIDANDMHYWNSKVGYQGVDKHLYAIGKALVEAARTKETGLDHRKRRAENQSGMLDLVSKVPSELVIRTNGSNGDEFLVDLYCREQDVVNVVKRLFDAAYKKQMDL